MNVLSAEYVFDIHHLLLQKIVISLLYLVFFVILYSK